MNYSLDEFLALTSEIEFQGGTHLDEECKPIKIRQKKVFPGGKNVVLEPARCGEAALFEVPYKLERTSKAGEFGIIKVCAVDDDLGKWPRFAHALKEDEDVS